MDHIWSPWRMKYIRANHAGHACVFCEAIKNQDDEKYLVIHRGQFAFVILNKFPYTSGHVMVVPNSHIGSFEQMDAATSAEVMELIRRSMQAIGSVYQPDGYNMGANLGASAGAGIADHIHFHLVPRWDGDTNYMTSIAKTRVLPEDLCETYAKLRNAWPGDTSEA
jgi:ATP adenylyltransferase